jgi:hypothetical protein
MDKLMEIRQEIDRLSARRVEVMRELSEGFDATLKAEHLELEERIAQLWEEQRNARALLRFGDRDAIIQRARQEERLSRAAEGKATHPRPLRRPRAGDASMRALQSPPDGALAQLGERRLCKAEVIGSIPIRSTERSCGVEPIASFERSVDRISTVDALSRLSRFITRTPHIE